MKRKKMTAIGRISNREQLKRRIAVLQVAMEEKELQLKKDLKEVHQSLRASNLVRNALEDIRDQPDLRMGIAQAATDIGAHALIDKLVFRKNRNFKNYLLSVVLKKIADRLILRKPARSEQTGTI